MRVAEFIGLCLIGLCVVGLAYQSATYADAIITLANELADTNATVASIIAERDAERAP